MVQLNFNASGVKPNAALEPVPSGNYPVIITASQKKPTAAGTGAYIELEMTIQGGEFSGRKLFDRLNIENPNQTAVDIAYATLSAICHVTGRLNITDTQQLHGVPFVAVAIKKPRNDMPDVPTNEVRGYKDINGNDPGKAPGNGGGGGQQNWGGQNNNGGQQGNNGNNGPSWGNQNGGPTNMNNGGQNGGGHQQNNNGGGNNGGQQNNGGGDAPWQQNNGNGNGNGNNNGSQLNPNDPPPWAQNGG